MGPISRNNKGRNIFIQERKNLKMKLQKKTSRKNYNQSKKQISNRTDIQNATILKICLSQFPTEMTAAVQSATAEHGDLEIGDHSVDKIVYWEKKSSSSTRLQYPCLSQGL